MDANNALDLGTLQAVKAAIQAKLQGVPRHLIQAREREILMTVEDMIAAELQDRDQYADLAERDEALEMDDAA